MKRLLLVVAAAVLSACASVPAGSVQETKDSVQTVALKYCPTIETAMIVVALQPGLLPETIAKLEEAKPVVHAICTQAQVLSAADLSVLANKAIPLVIEAIATSGLSDGEKQAAIITLALAQVAMAQVK